MAILWPIGCPLSLLLLLKSYSVPEIAARKLRTASTRAFLVYSLAQASEVGIDATEGPPVRDSSASKAPLEDPGRSRRRRSTGHNRRVSHSAPERLFAGMQSYACLEDMAGPLLNLLCKVHGIDVSSPIKTLTKALAKRMDELLGSGEVVVPLVIWDDKSPDPAEQLAVRRLEGLIGAYEVEMYWYARCCAFLLGVVCCISGYSIALYAHKCACTRNRFLDLAPRPCTRFEIFEFIRKLLLIGVLTAVSESSQAYLNVAHAVSFFSLLIFAKCQPFVDPKLDRCGWDRWTLVAPAQFVAEVWWRWSIVALPVDEHSSALRLRCAPRVGCKCVPTRSRA
jgi:hypothetical protein